MQTLRSVIEKVGEAGIRGAIAGALRRLARVFEGSHQRISRPDQQDEFVQWVRYAVPGMLMEGNIPAFEFALTHMPRGQPVLEIGSFCGLSSVVISHLMGKNDINSQLFTCDAWAFEGQRLGAALAASTQTTHDDYRKYVRDTFVRSMRTFTPNALPATVECTSDEFFRQWFARATVNDVFGRRVELGGTLGFCYIDGNHTYEFARRDYENADRVLVRGGFILFDDSADGSHWEVNRLTREIARDNRYELVSKNPNYLFRRI